MSGHSKWATIKRKKAANDAKKGAAFTKLIKSITVAVKSGGGGSIDTNFKLKLAVDKAKQASMPISNIENAIKKASGEAESGDLEELVYEGYGPSGLAVIIEVTTDNRHRTAAEVRHIFSKNGGSLGESGSVSYLFSQKGSIFVPFGESDAEAVMMELMDAPVEDIEEGDDGYMVYTAFDKLHEAQKAIEGMGYETEDVSLVMMPSNQIAITDESEAKKVVRLIDMLEENEDVSNVYTNADFDESVLGEIE